MLVVFSAIPLSNLGIDSPDEGLKASTAFSDILSDLAASHSGDPTKTAFNRAFQTDLPYWTWLSSPENAYLRERFAIAMEGVSKLNPPSAILHGARVMRSPPWPC